MQKRPVILAPSLLIGLSASLLLGCPGPQTSRPSGGASGSGGSQGSGGHGAGSGGDRGTGGTSGSGDTNGSGGAPGSGGASSTSSGGSGPASSGGGSGSGGSGSGGRPGSGGMNGSGGAPATGGAQGTGGSAGRGVSTNGTGGAGGGSGGAGSGGAAGSAGSGKGFFSEDFESGTMGKAPAGWDNFISYNFNTTNPQSDGTGAVIDNKNVHGGKLALKVHSTGNPVMIERALPAGTKRLYVRGYFYMTRQLGMGPQSANHETLLGLNKDPKSANDQVRFGEIKGVIGTNEVPSDNIAPKMAEWYMGPIVSANAWHCIEVAFIGDASPNTLTAWADGKMVHQIAATTDWQNGTMPATWLNGKFVDVMFGWQSFSSAANDVWIDDLVLSNDPIGCN